MKKPSSNRAKFTINCVLLYWRHLPARLLYNDFGYKALEILIEAKAKPSKFPSALKLMKEDTGFIKRRKGKKESASGVLKHHHSCVHLSYVVKFP